MNEVKHNKADIKRPAGRQQAEAPRALLPPVDVFEDAAGITLLADLPGVSKDSLTLQVDADTLTIEGEITLRLPEGMEATHVELDLPRYRRVFTLSRELDPERVDAAFKHGVLTVRIPKAPHAQARRIDVQVH